MSKCETCIHYSYRAGISAGLARQLGLKDIPSEPTCYCDYAKISWRRDRAEVRKPLGIPCEYKKRLFTCVYCGGHNISKALITCSISGEMVCKKCVDRKYEEYKAAQESEATYEIHQ